MVPLVKQSPPVNHSDTVLSSCCNCLHLIDAQVNKTGQKADRRLWLSLCTLCSFFVAELSIGLWSSSLSLLADAGHMLSDVAALGITLFARRLAQRPPRRQATFGHGRVEILAASINGLALLVLAAFIALEAVSQFSKPQIVLGLPMLIVAGVGLIINSINIALLYQVSRNNLNLRGAFLHVVVDAASSVSIIIAALAVYYWNWTWIDAIVSLVITCFVGCTTIPIVRQGWEILMEYAPRNLDLDRVEAVLNSYALVESVEKLHIWTITSGRVLLSAHLIVNTESGQQRDQLLKQLQAHLAQEFGICETTLQFISRKSTLELTLHPLFKNNLIDLFAQKQFQKPGL